MLRWKRGVQLLQKVKQVCHEVAIDPKAVPLKILLSIFENASLEDDEDLHDRWANLLANVSSPAFTEPVQGPHELVTLDTFQSTME